MPANNPYDNPTYKRNRKRLLADQPMCVARGCGKPADTADHIIGLDQGGTHDLENLQPLCRSCNSRRGAQYVNAKTGKNTRQKAVQTPGTATKRPSKPKAPAKPKADVFGATDLDPDHPRCTYLSQSGEPVMTGEDSSRLVAVRTDRPRLETIRSGTYGLGAQVADWSKVYLGIELMPWQTYILDGMLATDEAGKLKHRQSLVSVARQNGKTTMLRALVGWALTRCAAERGEPQTVITMAHALDLGVQLFYDLAPILEERFGGEAKWSYGRNQITMPDGSLWLVRAATGGAGHGRGAQWIIVDEVWDVSPEVIDQGLLPAQIAQKSPLLAMFSTAGTEASKAMIRWREQGLRLIDNQTPGPLYFAEYSPPSDVDVVNRPDLWHLANPALGHTITMDALEAQALSPDRAAFLRGHLNMWVSTNEGWLPPGTWEPALAPDRPTGPPTVLATDTSHDGDRHVGIAAHAQPDGTVIVTTAFVVGSEAEKWAELERLAGPRTIVAITPNIEIHCPAGLKARKTIVGQNEITKWTGLVRSMILDGRLKHCGEVMLSEHVNRAVGAQTATGLVLSSMRSPGPIEMARCMVWAAALASKPVSRSKPTVVAARRP